MTQKSKLWLSLCVFILVVLIAVYPAFAEIKVFEKEVEEVVGRDQSQEQVEAFALQKAKRLAVEEAGTYISSLTVVQTGGVDAASQIFCLPHVDDLAIRVLI